MTGSKVGVSASLAIECVHGALLGAVMGDALGWPYEQNAGRIGPLNQDMTKLAFSSWRRRSGGRFQPHEEEIEAGMYSDDTQLILATARSLMRHDGWGRYLARHEIPLWLSYEKGGGGATKRAAESCRRGIWPWQDPKRHDRYFEAGGNGVAMRILPHVLIRGQSENHLLRDVFRNGIITHGHPRALLGARLYAQAAWWIAHTPPPIPFGSVIEAMFDTRQFWEKPPEYSDGAETTTQHWMESADKHFASGYLTLWRDVVRETCDGLELCRRALHEGALADDFTVLKQLRCFDRTVNGSGIIASLAVLYLFAAHAADPFVGMRTIAFARSADTDTLASMLGGLFGLCYGLDWIPEPLQRVQDRELIAETANQLLHPRENSSDSAISQWSDRNDAELRKQLLQGDNERVSLGALGEAQIIDRKTLKSLARGTTIAEWRLRTTFGQTMFIKILQKTAVDQERAIEKPQHRTKKVQPQEKETSKRQQSELFAASNLANVPDIEIQVRTGMHSAGFARASELLSEAVHMLPAAAVNGKFFQAVADALHIAPLTFDSIIDLLNRQKPHLSLEQQQVYSYLLKKYLLI
jgi:ADP-ribosylglycohydrolase